MNLQQRVDLFGTLKSYLEQDDDVWKEAKMLASKKNSWFIPEFIYNAVQNILTYYLDRNLLQNWINFYHLDDNIQPRNVGIVMAGNIPLVGFHDFVCVFISGHFQTIKLSSKDDVLLRFIIEKLYSLEPATKKMITIAENLKGCDAYIATGTNNSARYFEQYFSRYPNIIRRNKTSAAILTGTEIPDDLERLSDDIHLYYGLGCRNVTKIFVPEGYDFVPLLNAFNKYSWFKDQNKYANNYDYQLSILLLNNVQYMTNGSTLLIENKSLFSAISVVHFEYYKIAENPGNKLRDEQDLQCLIGQFHTAFGLAQRPGLFDYADGLDTMQFLLTL